MAFAFIANPVYSIVYKKKKTKASYSDFKYMFVHTWVKKYFFYVYLLFCAKLFWAYQLPLFIYYF